MVGRYLVWAWGLLRFGAYDGCVEFLDGIVFAVDLGWVREGIVPVGDPGFDWEGRGGPLFVLEVVGENVGPVAGGGREAVGVFDS